jgi:hypothetical protein
MFSGEIGDLQPRTSYAVARTIGSTEMAQHSPAWKLNLLVWRENAGVVRFYEKLGYSDQDCVALGNDWTSKRIELRDKRRQLARGGPSEAK